MKKLLLSLAAVVAVWTVSAAELDWMTDLPKAIAKAKEEKKTVLVDFTGSDWCGFCIKLQKGVFGTPEFAKFAKENLVLVELDFPRSKPLPDALKKANAALKDQYKISGFPTLVYLNGQGKEIGRQVGYGGESAPKFIAEVEKIRSKS